jgi:hypothetical protein
MHPVPSRTPAAHAPAALSTAAGAIPGAVAHGPTARCVYARPAEVVSPGRASLGRAAAVLLLGLLLSATALAEPFVIEDMPADLDGLVHPWMAARAPVAVDFNGDGQPSWYAGGNRIAHPKQPTPIDPLRYASAALPAISLPVCPSCTPRNLAFAAADIDRDGDADIVRLNRWVGQGDTFTLQVFLGDGSNGFSPGWRLDWVENTNNVWGERYFQIALQDFDRDGDPDLAVLSTHEFINTSPSIWRDEGRLSIRWNQSNGFATETVLQSSGFTALSSLLALDFEADGDIDILVNEGRTWSEEDTFNRNHREYANNGAGTFAMAEVFGDQYRYAVDVIDLNRDSFSDLLVNAGALSWSENNGGCCSPPQALIPGVISGTAIAADLNEDGRPDIVSTEPNGSNQPRRLMLRRAQPSSIVGLTEPELLATLPSDILQVSAGDALGDADADLLLRLANGSFRLVRNQAQRLQSNSAPAPSSAFNGLAGLTRLAVSDLNRDGMDDLLALQPSGPRMHRALAVGPNNFAASEFKILASDPSDFAVGDFDRDGRSEFAYVAPASGAVRTVTQNDGIFFGWPDTQIGSYPGAALIRAGHAANYNGTLDLLVASSTSGGLRWFRNIDGAQSWTTTDPVATQEPIPQSLALAPRYFGVGDAGFTCSADGIALHIKGYSNVLGWFQSASLVSVQTVAQTGVCAMANLDNDAELEVVFIHGGGQLLWWKPDNNPIVTATTIAASVNGLVRAIVPVDWNRDGLNDLLVATSQGLYLYARQGLADSWTVRLLQASTAIVDLVVVDSNRDSLPDAAVIQGNDVRLVINQSRVAAAMTPPSYPAGQPVQLQPGQSGIALEIGIANPGRLDEDASVAVVGTRVTFNRAQQSAGIWSMGSAMTRAEVEQAVASVSLLVNGQVVGTAGTSAVDANGQLQISYASPLGAVVPIPAADSRQMSLRVNLKSSAASATYSSFYLSQPPGVSTAQVLHAGQAVGKTTPIDWPLLAVSNRISFEALPPPEGPVFRDGFEG